MAIDGITGNNGTQGVDPAESRPQSPEKAKAKSAAGGQDRVSLSETKEQFARIRQLVDSTSDVRAARLQELSLSIDRGTYKVDETDLADAIIQKSWIDMMA